MTEADDPFSPSPCATAGETRSARDAARGREFPVELWFPPGEETPRPLVVISHRGGSGKAERRVLFGIAASRHTSAGARSPGGEDEKRNDSRSHRPRKTDLVFDLLRLPDWRVALQEGPVKPMQWFVYYGDVTALKAVLEAGGDLASIDRNAELGNAAFFGHWKVCDFLLARGADARWSVPETGETPLHGALAKAGRPHYLYVVRRLVESGADPNAKTIPGRETAAFMRDVRTRGETPLHRAAAYADATTIEYLLAHGADREARDAQGASPLTWASEHLRPGVILSLLAFGPHRLTDRARDSITSDHGAGWGNGMERKLLGDYLPEEE